MRGRLIMNNIKNNYLVSVIIPTHNGKKMGGGLKDAIDSIINQSMGFENIELIIVDDASDDKITPELILEYQSQYPDNIKPIFLDENSGYPGKPRNIGLDHVTSKYVLFLDHDDCYIENGIETLYNAIIKYNSDVIIANHYNKLNGEKILHMKHLKEDIININPLDSQNNFDLLNKYCSGVVWGKIWKTDFIVKNKLKFIENSYNDDGIFYIDVLKHSPQITILPNNVVYIYNVYQQSSCRTHNMDLFNDSIYVTLTRMEHLNDLNFNLDTIFNGLNSLFIIFSNLNSDDKKKAVLKIYKLEKYLEKKFNFKIQPERKEMNILNKAIMQKKFQKAIFISNIYKKLYNSLFIKKLFYKFYLK